MLGALGNHYLLRTSRALYGDYTDNVNSGHALRKNTAGAFGPDLARKLSQLVKMEKNVMRSMEMVSRERMETAVCLAIQLLGTHED